MSLRRGPAASVRSTLIAPILPDRSGGYRAAEHLGQAPGQTEATPVHGQRRNAPSGAANTRQRSTNPSCLTASSSRSSSSGGSVLVGGASGNDGPHHAAAADAPRRTGVLAFRLQISGSSTQDVSGSMTITSAGAPLRGVPPGRPSSSPVWWTWRQAAPNQRPAAAVIVYEAQSQPSSIVSRPMAPRLLQQKAAAWFSTSCRIVVRHDDIDEPGRYRLDECRCGLFFLPRAMAALTIEEGASRGQCRS